ncbi:PKD domain-containing protein, partial [Chitinophaga sp.]|uniref:PKD domain-containing protein n=1 Tax=Chitinophaga sp. TaxID=1869181 RepID=UPI002FDDCEBD
YFLFAIVVSFTAFIQSANAQIQCTSPQRICGNTVVFAPELAQNLGTLSCVNNVNYPGFYFFEGGSSGDATIRATATNGNIILDYVLYGPYFSIQSMQSACGNLASQPVMSCFNGNSSAIDITFPSVAPGQWYLLVLVNRNGQSGNITLSQSGGSASFNCCQLDARAQLVRPVCASTGQGGYIQIQPINVTGSIEFSKDGGQTWQSSNEFNNLAAGTYNIVVRDQSLCVKAFTVTVPGDITNNFITPPSQSVCEGQQPANFQGSQPAGGDGTYTYLWQRSETDANNNFNPAPGVNNQQNYTPPIANRTYWYRRQVISGGCPSNTTGVPVTISGGSTPANAGPDQTVCGGTQFNLQGNVPASGTGQWTQVSGPAATIGNPTYFNTEVTPTTAGVYVFRWTITSPGCGSNSDDVAITVGGAPTTADAGADLSRCQSTTAALSGNTPTVGTGMWTQVSGPTAVITDPHNPGTVVAQLVPGATHVFRWTISSGSCGSSADEMSVTVFDGTTAANAGPDQTVCNVTQASLAGNAPLNGTGTWSQVSGPNTAAIASPNNAATNVSGLTAGTYVFRWTISNGVCIPSTDDVQIVVAPEPTPADPGPNQVLCNVQGATMAATAPSAGTGAWSQVSGPTAGVFSDINNPAATVTNLTAGAYVFAWTITSGNCRQVSQNVSVQIFPTPDNANAGPDQTQYNSGTFVMNANTPVSGNGRWTVVSGQAIITNATLATTSVTIPVNSTAVLRWVIGSGACPPSTDDVTLRYTSQADMQVVKTDAGSVYQTGKQVKYQVVITNNGPSDMAAANFQDVLPAELENYNWSFVTTGNGVTVTPNSGTSQAISATVSMPFAAGNRIVLNVTGTVKATSIGGTVVRNTAAILSPTIIPDPVPGNNTSTVDSVIANNPPDAVPDFYDTFRDVAVSGNVKTNDSDPDNDAMTVQTTAVEPPARGSVIINADGTFTYTPNAGVTGTDVFVYRICDTQGACDTAHVYINVKPPYVDLQLEKTASLTEAVAGQPLQYIVKLTNGGPSTIRPADRISMNDNFPVGYTPLSVTASAGTFDLGKMIWTDLTLAPGASATLTIQGAVDADFTGASLKNVATATPPPGMSDSTLAKDSVTTPVNRSADLAITKTDNSNIYVPGGQVTYVITVTNNGPSNANGATVTDAFPSGITSGSWTATAVGGAIVPVNAGSMPLQQTINLPSGGEVVYRVTLDVPPDYTGALTNTASVAPPTGVTDPVPGNNSASDTNTPTPVYGLRIVKNGPSVAVAGESIQYLLTVYNVGPSAAPQVTITDAVPAQITNVTWTVQTTGGATASTASGTGNGINFNGSLPVGDTNLIIVSVSGTISQGATGSFRNIGVVAVPGDTQVVSNVIVTTLRKQTGISIIKSGPITHTVDAGRDISYSISVVNAGPSNATNVVIADQVPATIGNTAWRIVLKGGATLAAGAPSTGTGNTVNTTVNIPAGAGNEVDVIVTGTVASSATGNLVNTATATPPGETPESDTDTTVIINKPGPSIVKSGPATADAGASITYTLLIGNSGPSDMRGAVIADAIPGSIENVSWTATTSGTASIIAGATGTSNLLAMSVNIPAGAQNIVTVTITGTIRPDASGVIRNNAFMSVNGDVTTSNTIETVVSKKTALNIRKQAPDTARAGDVIRFQVNVTNNGPSDAFGVVVRDTFPAGLLNPQFTITVNGAAKLNSSKVENGVGILNADLPAGSANNIIITATATIAPDFEGVITNRAIASVTGGPDVPSNTTNTVVINEPSLVVSKAGPANVTAGGDINYVLVIRNNGLADAKQVVIRDVVPAIVTGVSWVAAVSGKTSITAGASGSGNTVLVTADIPAGIVNTVTINIRGKIGPDASGTFRNTATATPTGRPGFTSNTVETQVLNSPALQIGKSAPRALAAGSDITWQIVVNNTGLSDARNVVIADVIPAEVGNVSWTATATDGAAIATGGTGTGSNVRVTGGIPAGGNASIVVTITGTVSAAFTGVISNIATVVADNVPLTSAEANTTIYNLSRIQIVKSGPDTANAGDRISYQITVDNNGPSDAMALRINDLVPAEIINPSWIATGRGAAQIVSGATGSGRVLDVVADIPYGTGNRVLITLTGTLNPAFEGKIVNTATVLADGQPVLSNTVTTQVVKKTSLNLVKIGPDEIIAGEPIAYVIYITNFGPSVANEVELDDVVPVEVQNVAWKVFTTGTAVVDGAQEGIGNDIRLKGSLPMGRLNSIVLTVEGVVDPSFEGNLLNVSSAHETNVSRNFTDSVITKVINVSALDVVKSAPDTLAAGDQITYSINVTNNGPSNSGEATIRDTIPAGINNVRWVTTTAGAAALSSPATGTGNIIEVKGNIPAGNPHRILLTVSGTIDPSFTGASLLNVAHVTHGGSAFLDSARTGIVSRPNVSVNKTGPAVMNAGDPIQYHIRVHNNGPSTANGLRIIDAIPAGILNPVWTATANGAGTSVNVTSGSGNVDIIAELPASAAHFVDVNVTGVLDPAYVGTSFANTAYARIPGITSDSSAVTTQVLRSSDLRVLKTGPTLASAGSRIDYRIVVRNFGPSFAQGAVIRDTVPAEVLSTSWTAIVAGGATVSSSAGTGNLILLTGDIPVDSGEIVIHVTGTIDPAENVQTIRNSAHVTSAPGTSDPSEAVSTVVTTLQKEADLVIVKSGPSLTISGDSVIYTLLVTNRGLSDVTGALIKDGIPPEVHNTTVTATAAGSASFVIQPQTDDTVRVTANIPAGAAHSVTIRIAGITDPAAQDGFITNTATVTPPPDITETIPDNNISTIRTEIHNDVGVLISKTGPSSVNVKDSIFYTINVMNTGFSQATGVTITDLVPAGISGVTWRAEARGGANAV